MPIVRKEARKQRMPLKEIYMDSDARYLRFDEATLNGMLILDAKTGVILEVNSFLAEMLNYTPAELQGKKLWEIGLPKDTNTAKGAFQELIKKGSVHYNHLPLVTKDGLCIGVEVTGKVDQESGVKVVRYNIRSIGQREDSSRSERLIRHSHKIEAPGQLAGGLAHDLNNLLAVILGYCEVLDDQADLPESSRKMILEIHHAGASAKNLTRRLLEFSRGQMVQSVAADLNETVNRMEKILSRLIGEDVVLVRSLGDNLGRINTDPSQLEQILMNLAINARDAMPRGGKITVETANVEIDESNAQQYPSMKPGRYVTLSVSDTGTGMDLETQSHIFEPFFTTKPFGQGTGLGLSTVFTIVEHSGGAITVDSQPDAGATFKIYFPRCDEVLNAKWQSKTVTLHEETGTILLVDDSSSLRRLMRRHLENCGYTVLDSDDPTVALSMAAEHLGPIHLMITDVVLPGLSGPDLAARVTQTRPETKVLFVSGYNDDSIAQLLASGHGYTFLKKPFSQDELLIKVRHLLGSSIELSPRPAT